MTEAVDKDAPSCLGRRLAKAAAPSEGEGPTARESAITLRFPSQARELKRNMIVLQSDWHVADLAPADPALIKYDEQHLVTHLRMLDANADGADWCELSRIVPHIDAGRELTGRGAYVSHLGRAKWMTEVGYRQLLPQGWPLAVRGPLTRPVGPAPHVLSREGNA